MRSMELQCFAALNGNSTYSAASIACNCVERYFEMSASLPQTQRPKFGDTVVLLQDTSSFK